MSRREACLCLFHIKQENLFLQAWIIIEARDSMDIWSLKPLNRDKTMVSGTSSEN